MGLAAFTLAARLALPLARVPQLMYEARLLVFGEGAGDLAHHLAARVLTGRQVIAGRGHEANATTDQERNAEFLRHQLTREAASVLDDDGPHAVGFDAVEQRREARPVLDRVGAGDGSIVELADDFEATPLGEVFDRLALTLFAVFVGADVGGRTGSQIGQSWQAGLVGSRHDLPRVS